jgi:glycine C-acetyltransferase
MSSVRFICGTQDIHKTLEKNFDFYGTEDTILYAGFDANGVLSLYLEKDAIISDSLNHASIDGVVCVKQHVTVMQIVTWKI